MKKITRFAASSFAAFATGLLLAASASASVLTSNVSVDNVYTIYVSTDATVAGTAFGNSNDWGITSVNSTTLAAGTDYYLHVAAADTGGIAGFLGDFSLTGTGHHFANGTSSLLTNNTSWTGNAEGFDAAFGTVNSFAMNGSSPWSFRGGISANAEWIWYGNPYENDISYFSARILADAPAPANVPEPATLGLMGFGLLGLARLRGTAAKRDRSV